MTKFRIAAVNSGRLVPLQGRRGSLVSGVQVRALDARAPELAVGMAEGRPLQQPPVAAEEEELLARERAAFEKPEDLRRRVCGKLRQR
jgi:hypothetical protein